MWYVLTRVKLWSHVRVKIVDFRPFICVTLSLLASSSNILYYNEYILYRLALVRDPFQSTVQIVFILTFPFHPRRSRHFQVTKSFVRWFLLYKLRFLDVTPCIFEIGLLLPIRRLTRYESIPLRKYVCRNRLSLSTSSTSICFHFSLSPSRSLKLSRTRYMIVSLIGSRRVSFYHRDQLLRQGSLNRSSSVIIVILSTIFSQYVSIDSNELVDLSHPLQVFIISSSDSSCFLHLSFPFETTVSFRGM